MGHVSELEALRCLTMRRERARLLARLACLSLIVALLVVRGNDLLQVLEDLGAAIGATTLATGSSFGALLALLLHLLHLTLSLAHSELLSEGKALLAQLLLLLRGLCLERRLDLALLGGTLPPLFLLCEL